MWETILSIKYEDYLLSLEEQNILKQKVDNLLLNVSLNMSGQQIITAGELNENGVRHRRLLVTLLMQNLCLGLLLNKQKNI